MSESTAVEGLAQRLEAASYAELPRAGVERVKEAFLDFLGVAAFGYGLGSAGLGAFARDAQAPNGATVIGEGVRVPCAVAAGVNAQRAYDTDFDESGPGNHTFSIIAATALAVGERERCDGRTLLAAMATAYQANGRFHRTLRDSAAGIRHLPLNSAVCAAKVLKLDAARLQHAIELAWMLAPVELDVLFRGQWWQSVGQGNVVICNAGIQAALLARHGVKGPTGLLEASGGYDLAELARLDAPAPHYYVEHEMHLKPWIGSRGVHAAIQVVQEWAASERLAPEQIETIEIGSRAIYMAPPFDLTEPGNWRDAASSIPWSIAMVLLGYPPGPEWLAPERLSDRRAIALAGKVRLCEDQAATAIWRTGQRSSPELANTVTIFAAGRWYERSLRIDECLGSPAHPLTRQQVVEKFTRLANPVIGPSRAEEVVRFVMTLERQPDLEPLAALLGQQ